MRLCGKQIRKRELFSFWKLDNDTRDVSVVRGKCGQFFWIQFDMAVIIWGTIGIIENCSGASTVKTGGALG